MNALIILYKCLFYIKKATDYMNSGFLLFVNFIIDYYKIYMKIIK